MEKQIFDFLIAHQTIIWLGVAWNFSAFMSSLPPLSPNAGYWTRTFHDYFQLIAANLNKKTQNPTTMEVPAVTVPNITPTKPQGEPL